MSNLSWNCLKQLRQFALVLGASTLFFALSSVWASSSVAQTSTDFSVICRSLNISAAELRQIEDVGGSYSETPVYEGSRGRPAGYECLVPGQAFPDQAPPAGSWQLMPDIKVSDSNTGQQFDGEIKFSEGTNLLIFASIKFFAINFVLWMISRIF